MLIKELIIQIRSNIFTLSLVLIALLTLLLTLKGQIAPKRVKVKKRIIQKDSKAILFMTKVINKSKALVKIKEEIRIKIGLVSTKSNQKNNITATVIVFVLLVVILLSVMGILLIPIPIFFKLLVIAACAIIPYVIISANIAVRRKKIYNDFPELVSGFTSQLAGVANIKEALKRSLPDMPKSLRYEIKRLINSMNSSEDYIKALNEFDERVDYIMCSSFVSVLKTAQETNTDIIASMIELEDYIAQEREDEHDKVEKIRDKKWNIYLLILGIVAAYFGVVYGLGSRAINYYWHTVEGQVIIGAAFIFTLIAILGIQLEEHL